METLESSRVCRLCGKHSGISINIFDKNENHVKKINAVLPIMVHEMDLLPKHMCHCCSYKLEEFHKFYVECLRTDANLKSQLSWMSKEEGKERVARGAPMVHIENLNIKVEPADYEVYELEPIVENVSYVNSLSSVSFPVNGVRNGIPYPAYARCRYCCDKTDQSSRRRPSFEEPRCCSPTVDERDNCDVGSSSDTVQAKQAVKRDPSPWELAIRSTRRLRLDDADARKSGPRSESRAATVRNLRPRKGPIDYGGPARRAPGASKSKSQAKFVAASSIKMEKLDDFEGRVLRPRKAIDYMESRRYTRTVVKREKLAATKASEPTSSRALEPFDYSEATVRVKQEPPDEFTEVDTALVDSLPNNMLANVKSDASDHARHTGHAADCGTFPGIAKRRRSRCSVSQRRKTELPFVNGTAKSFDGDRVKSERLRRSVRCTAGQKSTMEGARSVTTNSPKTITPFKLVDSVKHYCEKCNVSFANKELYKLHACYV